MVDLGVHIGGLALRNPVIAGSCEVTMTEAGIKACLDAGAGAVIAKSINESPDAARQLDIADYRMLAPDWSVVPWSAGRTDPTGSFFCRSGLAQTTVDAWVELLERCDAHARRADALLVGSITVADKEAAAGLAARMSEVVRCIELNLSAPHGREAKGGAVRLATEAQDVTAFVTTVRSAITVPLWVKLTAQTADVVTLAEAAVDGGADVVVMTGRYLGFMPDLDTWDPVLGSRAAIGGGWALPTSLYWVSRCRAALPAGTPIVGTNGARSGLDVARFLLAGATAVEVATVLFERGPEAITDMVTDLARYADDHGVQRIQDFVGVTADRSQQYGDIQPLPPERRHWPWSKYLQGD